MTTHSAATVKAQPSSPQAPPRQAPDWDLTAYFPALGGDEYCAFRDGLRARIAELEARAGALAPLGAASQAEWAELLLALEAASAELGHLRSYLSCVTAADSADELGRREESGLARLDAGLEKVSIAVRAALAAAEDAAFAALLADPRLAPVRYFLERLRQRAARSMAPQLEALTAELAVDGFGAWGRLYNRISGSLSFELELPGRAPIRVPVSQTRTLLEDTDPAVRRAALHGSGAAWQSAAESVAACLNAISGTRLALQPRRGIGHFLEPALFDAGIERGTLEALWSAVRERQEVARRYLRHKAGLLGLERLGFQDLMAPLPSRGDARIPWGRGVELVTRAFGSRYPRLGEFAERAIAARWIDYQPRAHKRPGGFCTSSALIGQSRVFLTYNGGLGDLKTLAHELGHAFHNALMGDLRSWQRRYPMTLAETASTFAEQLVTDAVLADPQTPAPERAAMLDARLREAEAFLLNIPMRFDFEHELYTRRAAGELGVRELVELMLDAQRRNYGDALDPAQLDPWFWASKLHFYITGVSFYNFPYSFGYLFSLGIRARARSEGPSFFPRYEALLRSTGSAPAEQVARDALGVELGSPEFWHHSIDSIEEDLREYLKLAN